MADTSGSSGQGISFVFSRGKRLFAVDAVMVVEIIEVPEITRIPSVSPVVRGVINHHGDILPILEVDQLLGIEATANPGSLSGEETAFILGSGEQELVISMDGTPGLLELPTEAVQGEGIIRYIVTQSAMSPGAE